MECCYAADGGSSCNRDLILSDLSQIYQEWFAAGQWCDRTDGLVVVACNEVTTRTTAEKSCQEMCQAVPSVTNNEACNDMKWYCDHPNGLAIFEARK